MNGAWDEGSKWRPGLARIREWSGEKGDLEAVVLIDESGFRWRLYDRYEGPAVFSEAHYPTVEAARDACVLWLSTKRLAGEFVDL